ncbi:protein takeout-like [Ctenocephalides felis]|uniref:protein takeout-like n=1 Tax=Ctenocephalides felis TaxID=7515 RepID=UPI000E6E195F|nr:protein takeout-like [Ctenocephalides felis]XP_026470943.1 protein takeout-like [Ctenocephalides felis]
MAFQSVTVFDGVSCNFFFYPSNVPRCKFEDTTCLQKAIEEALFVFKDGSPKIHMAKVDPLHISGIHIDQGMESPIAVKLNFIDNDLTGLSQITVKKVESFSTEKLDWKLHLLMPRLELYGDYNVSGRVLVLPIVGQGKSNLTIVNTEATAIIQGRLDAIEKNGKKYHQIDNFELDFVPKRLHIYLGNLFNGDKALGDNMNVFLNENWQDIFNELKPAVQDSFAAVFKELANRMFKKVSFNDIYLS